VSSKKKGWNTALNRLISDCPAEVIDGFKLFDGTNLQPV